MYWHGCSLRNSLAWLGEKGKIEIQLKLCIFFSKNKGTDCNLSIPKFIFANKKFGPFFHFLACSACEAPSNINKCTTNAPTSLIDGQGLSHLVDRQHYRTSLSLTDFWTVGYLNGRELTGLDLHVYL